MIALVVAMTSNPVITAYDGLGSIRDLVQQTYTLTPEDGVTVTLSGMMPVYGSAEAEPVETDDSDVLHAYDITIRYADGREFEPDEDEPISVSFRSELISAAIEDSGVTLSVEHIADNGEKEEVDLTLHDDEASFLAGSFSIYAIKTHESDAAVLAPRKTFRFLSNFFDDYDYVDGENQPQEGYYVSGLYQFPNKANKKVSFQIVRNGEKLQPVVIPQNFDWGHFYGWYIVRLDLEESKRATAVATGLPISGITEDTLTKFVYRWDNDPVQVDSVTPIEVTADETVYLAPLYTNYRFLTFHEEDDEAHPEQFDEHEIVTRKIIVLGNNGQCDIDISDVVADSPDPQSQIFYGWRFKGVTYQTRLSTGDTVHQSITITSADMNQQVGQGDDERIFAVDVYPVFKEARWITFVHGESDWNAQYVGAIFAYLYDTTVPEAQRVSITQLPSTTRPGYIFDGWWTGHMQEGDDGEDHIVYEQQVSMEFADETVTGNSQIIPTGGDRIYLGISDDPNTDTYIFKGRLYLKHALTLYAKWRAVDHADYKIVVWKQDVTDSKTATDSQKTYDYYDYMMMENANTGDIILDSAEFNALGWENLTESSDPEVAAEFNFFHYSRTIVEVGGRSYNGAIPAERVEGIVSPDSSTVVNIYYDRDLMAINFYYSNGNLGGTSGAYTYTETSAINNNTTYYGLTANGYEPLRYVNTPEEYYTFAYNYAETTSRQQNGMYGIVNDEFVPLTSYSVYVWTPQYVYTQVDTSSITSNGYALYNGEYSEAYYNNGHWYRNRTLWIYYSDEIDQVYTRESGSEYYTGTRYTRSGRNAPYTYTVTTGDNNTQYMTDQYGGHAQLTRSSSYNYRYNNAEYTGTLYRRTNNNDNSSEYTGTLYKKVNDVMTPLGEGESYNGTLYGSDTDGHYQELKRQTEAVYTWTVASSGETYTGPRYTRANKQGSSYMLTWTGLYGQTFAQNGYSWSTVENYAWTGVGADGNSTTQTLLDGFSEPKNPYDLTRGDSSGNYTLYHYKQNLDGTYSTDQRYTAHYASNNTTFNFSDKFEGFSLVGYSSSFNANFDPNNLGANEHTATAGTSTVALTGNTLHIYHKRKAFTLTLTNFTTENNAPDQPNDKDIDGILYEQLLTGYGLTPPARENYTFSGWYYDKAFTKAVDFEHDRMPDGNLKIFSKWELKYFFVEIDPDGGEMEDQLEFSTYTHFEDPRKQSTYTWLQYGRKLSAYENIERRYIPDNTGTYVYVNVKFAESFAAAQTKSWDYCLPSKYRAAFYCPAAELDDVYYDHFADLVDSEGNQLITRDFFRTYCVDTTALYRPVSGQEHYVLAAWHKVNADGTTSRDMYNFSDPVTKPTRIRAVWRKAGEYSIEYNPYMRRYDVGRYVEQDGVMQENLTYVDPSDGINKYVDGAETKIHNIPNYIPDGYIFRGWQLLDANGHETGRYFGPGDDFTIASAYADNSGMIHMEAAYEPDKESVRRVDVTALTLDANVDYGGYAVKNGLDIYEDYNYVDLTNNQVLFTMQPNNFDVDLHDYYNNFRNSNGYMLIGWDDNPTATNFIPKYAADAIIGVNSTNIEGNVLYAIWEPMYYMTLENHSTQYDISFNLTFNNFGGVVYSNDTNEVVSIFEREIFSNHNTDSIQVSKVSDGNFNVTLKKAASANTPNGIKLVLPQGGSASYTVSGSINNTQLKTDGATLTVFNSGGTNATLAPNYSTTQYSVSGSMVHGEEGQTVAFYTEEPPHTNIHLAAYYYDPANDTWVNETSSSDDVGPESTISFSDLPNDVTPVNNVITLNIITQNQLTFSVEETYTETDKYKFIGWFSKANASPRDMSIDGREFGNYKVTGLIATNDPDKYYYALYVPYSDGTLSLSHDESQTSIGYPKRMYIEANYMDGSTPVSQQSEVQTMIPVSAALIHTKVHTQIDFNNFREPRNASEAARSFTINLKTMSGYGCVHYNTYEEGRALSDRIVDDSTIIDVHIDPYDANSASETKHYYGYILNRTVGDMFEDSESVKGYKTIKNIRFYSDFERKYEFVYNYVFRDGTTVRKYQVKDATAYLKSENDFRQFVFESAPYISNFGEEFVWKPDTIRIENLNGKGQVRATMDAVQTKNATVYVTVKRFDASIPWPIDLGTTFPKNNRPTADLIINGQQFKRWKIEDTETGELIGYCYSPGFTFAVWSNYTITPEYVPMTGSEYEYIAPDDETTSYVTLEYLDSTRNQWVGLDENNDIIVDAKGVATEHYDSLISDFSVLFIDKGIRINSVPSDYKLGLIYEVVGEIENTNIPDQYTVTPNDELRSRAIGAILNSNNTSGSITSGGKTKFYYSTIDPSTLTDVNRIEIYRGISNLAGENGQLHPNAKNVFNVYAYMRLPDGTVLQSDPVTFQLYDLAVRTVTG